jgi:galactokinase
MSADSLADAAVRLLGQRLGGRPDGVWFAPGRVNLIGEHTDYNDGYVLPLALPQGTAAAVSRRSDSDLRVVSDGQPETVETTLDALSPGVPDGWAAYVAGTLWALRNAGVDVPGLDVAVAGDVPLGAGLSSSASLECVVALAVDELTEAGLGRSRLAQLARHAENDYVGMPCGVLDQMASMHGQVGHLVFLDTRTLQVEHVPFGLSDAGLTLLVTDTRAPHRLVDGEYAQRRSACGRASALLGVDALRDVIDLEAALAALDDDELRRRVRHVVTENQRVLDVVELLRSGANPRAVGELLTASHASMRDDYEITVAEVDVAVEAALAAGAHGARMTGGGFGGSVIALVDDTDVATVERSVSDAFAARRFAAPHTFTAAASAGARRLR